MDKEAGQFRVLLAEDDTVSRMFLCEAIRACGGEPTACVDGPSALEQARVRNWDLLIFDHHLPALDGDAILAALRSDPGAAARHTAAIATTAEPDTARATLLQAGFAEVLPKPMSVQALRAVLERHDCHVDPLDDDGALRACGSATAVERLRRLFAEQELPRVQEEFDARGANLRALRSTLHRLRASCGFCGAPALARASEVLHQALEAGAKPDCVDAALAAFARALRETRAALHARLDGGR
jgi:CheY-like chemotaxis protein